MLSSVQYHIDGGIEYYPKEYVCVFLFLPVEWCCMPVFLDWIPTYWVLFRVCV